MRLPLLAVTVTLLTACSPTNRGTEPDAGAPEDASIDREPPQETPPDGAVPDAARPPVDAAAPLRLLVMTKQGLTAGGVWDHRNSADCTAVDPFGVNAQAAGIAALQQRAAERRWSITVTEDASVVSGVLPFDIVVFMVTSGGIFDDAQRQSLQAFVQSGGGVVIVHSSSTEPDWQWFQDLTGGSFLVHPQPPNRLLPGLITTASDVTTTGIAASWTHTDEFYAFVQDPTTSAWISKPASNPATNPQLTHLLLLDESSIPANVRPGNWTMTPHPLAWRHTFDGGRAFYTALGHCPAAFEEPVVTHLALGIDWAGGRL
jgi:type 1 glutamine amidotransferase